MKTSISYFKHQFYFSEKIKRAVKARDSFGQVMAVVHKAQAVKQQEALTRPETPLDTGLYSNFNTTCINTLLKTKIYVSGD